MKNKQNNSQIFKKNVFIGGGAAVLILVALSIICSFLWFRVDLTKDNRHSLSPATVTLLKNLEDKVYIRVYLEGDNLPADYQVFAKNVKDILQNFRNYSNKVFFEFIDPVAGKKNEEIVSILGEFGSKGLKPIPVTSETGSGITTQWIVPGAMISYKINEYPVTLAVSDPGGNEHWLTYSTQELEYNLVAAIRNLVNNHRGNVAFIEGHGELDFISTSWITYQLKRFYNVERITIDGKINSLRNIAVADSVEQTIRIRNNKYDALVIAQPTTAFSDYDKFIIDQHIMRGGKVLWLIDATTASIDSFQRSQELFYTARNLRLNNLFFKYGVRLNADLLQDLSCQSIPISTGLIGDQQQYKFIAFPYALNVVNFSSHPISRNIKSVKADFVGSVDFVGNQDLNKTVLMTSSDRTKIVPAPSIATLKTGLTQPNLQEFGYQNIPIAVLVEGVFQSAFDGLLPIEFDTVKSFGFINQSPPTRQIFISDGDLIRNRIDRQNGQPLPCGYDIYTRTMYENSDFIINCINYLCADDDLLTIRAKNFKIGTLKAEKIRNEGTKYAIINIAVPLFIVMIMGIVLNVLRTVKYSKRRKA
ncbi:MAG: gliding motility-associated ABC transporter substrate-binding protein GldG [Bacteroidales bacterium]|jgi:ABC-2 type transport system permease protein|nr:gliding motility-associated ABC transporter substrate-binding protein GldG [Bacteroidales bacterium]